MSASYRSGHVKPNDLSGSSSVNSSFVLHCQVLLNSSQPSQTCVRERGRCLHCCKTSPAFSPASKQLIPWGFDHVCVSYFLITSIGLLFTVCIEWCYITYKYKKWTLENASGQQTVGSLGRCLWWEMHLLTACNSCLPQWEEPDFLILSKPETCI